MSEQFKITGLIDEVAEGTIFVSAGEQHTSINSDDIADHLVSNGVTIQTTPVTYERLLEIARKMHCWIFLNTGDEQEVYDKLGLTDEENAVLGYSGQMVVSTNDGGLKNG